VTQGPLGVFGPGARPVSGSRGNRVQRPKVPPDTDLAPARFGRPPCAGYVSESMTAEQIVRYVVASAIWAPSCTTPSHGGSSSTTGRGSACTRTPTGGWPWPTRTAAR